MISPDSSSSNDDDMPLATPRQKFKRRRNAAPDSDDLMRFARGIWRRDDRCNERGRSLSEEGRMFNEWFGCDVSVALTLWALLEKTGNTPVCGEMCHMLWALAFMKGCTKEHVAATMFGADKDTVSKWVWLFIDAMANLEPDAVSL